MFAEVEQLFSRITAYYQCDGIKSGVISPDLFAFPLLSVEFIVMEMLLSVRKC